MTKFCDRTAMYKVAYSLFMLGYCTYHTKESFVLDWLATITHTKNMDQLYWKCIVEYNTENNTHISLSRSSH